MCVSGCVYIFFLYVCVRVCWSACARGNMCLNCQQREYTAKNKNSSVSIQRVLVCVCECVFVRPYFVLAFMSVCATVFFCFFFRSRA